MKQLIISLLVLLPLGLLAQHTVEGTVRGAEETLIGVNIRVKGTTTGTISDLDGNYRLEVPSPTDTLLFSYTGYAPQEVPIQNRSRIDIVLEEQTNLLDEIVVVGYGTQRKSDLTGSVSTIQSEDLVSIPTQSVGQALQGKVAGLQITPTDGAPGSDAIFRIRGTGSFNGADPLFVVDGMIVNDISFVNPQDVENVSVLKDASATAIYGARGANGVIIITTKRGEAGQEAQVNVTSYYGTQEVVRTIGLTNAQEYATLANELAANEGRPPTFADPDAFGEGTDWQDVIFQNAPIQSHQVSFTGGAERYSYNVSANFFGQEGIIRGSDFDRVTLRINNQYQLKPYLTLGHNVSLLYSDRMNGPGVVTSALRSAPTVPVFEEDGSFGNTGDVSSTGNPEATIFYNNNETQDYRVVGNVYLDVSFLDYFTFRTNLGADFLYREQEEFFPVFFVSAIQQRQENQLILTNNRNRNYLWENTLSFNYEQRDYRIDAVLGYTIQDFFNERVRAGRRNFVDERDIFRFFNAGEVGTEVLEGNVTLDQGLVSYLGRVNFTLFDRYLFTVSGRVDGSSRFGPNNRYGFFPSFALGWNAANEAWFANQSTLSRLKLRFSWGQTGNDRIGDFRYTALVEPGEPAVFGPDETLVPGATVIRLANEDLQWEETTQWDIGIEFGLLENRMQVEVDYYNRESDGVLFEPLIPGYLGADPPAVNVSSIRNSGVDFNLRWQDVISDNFSYQIGGIFSILENEVLELSGTSEDFPAGGVGFGGVLATNSRPGFPVGAFYGFETIGVFQNEAELEQFATLPGDVQQPGDLIFRDIDGDGVITADDQTIIGQPTPDFTYGFNTGVQAYGFDLSAQFIGQSGSSIVNAKRGQRFGLYNFERIFLDRWNGEGTSNTEPRLTTSGVNYENFSDRFIESGDFLRLRTLELGYTLPQNIVNRIGLNSLRIYLSATNLATWQDYTGYTPEIYNNSVFDVGIDRGEYPIAKTYLAGLNLSF